MRHVDLGIGRVLLIRDPRGARAMHQGGMGLANFAPLCLRSTRWHGGHVDIRTTIKRDVATEGGYPACLVVGSLRGFMLPGLWPVERPYARGVVERLQCNIASPAEAVEEALRVSRYRRPKLGRHEYVQR